MDLIHYNRIRFIIRGEHLEGDILMWEAGTPPGTYKVRADDGREFTVTRNETLAILPSRRSGDTHAHS